MSMKKLLDEMVTPISDEYGKFDNYFTDLHPVVSRKVPRQASFDED